MAIPIGVAQAINVVIRHSLRLPHPYGAPATKHDIGKAYALLAKAAYIALMAGVRPDEVEAEVIKRGWL